MKPNLPQFSKIDPKKIESQLTKILNKNREAIEQRLSKGAPFTWDNLIQPFDNLDDQLNQFWSPIRHLNAVLNSSELRKAYHACLPMLSDYGTELAHNQRYYSAIKSIAQNNGDNPLDFAQQKTIEHELRDFKLAGVALPPQQKKAFAELSKQLSQLTTKFDENVLDATQAWTMLMTDKKELGGLPKPAIQAAMDAAKKQNKKGWLFTLDIPSYLPVMMYADSASLRKAMYTAYTTRASDKGPNAGQWNNSNVMLDILKTRHKLAKLIGFPHYADYSLATKMLKQSNEVFHFLKELVDASLPAAKEEFETLKQFAKDELGLSAIQAWDALYVSEKLRKARYDLSQEALKPYFPEYKVLEGLFRIAKQLFHITIRPEPRADTWHPDAHCFAIYDQQDALISYFYLDLYARENKRGGAWMDDCRVRRRLDDGTTQIPVAFITCNFNAPIDKNPALFTHEEVLTLFHEFGHALQHMLTQIDYSAVSGISGVPWDAVEVASQFLENWAWEKESLSMASEHYQTKAPLPDELFEKMRSAKNFQSALQMVRQLEFALFDFRLHQEFDPDQADQIQTILDEVREQVCVTPVTEFNRFQHSFSHIFAGGYAAGYYSYQWAEVMASDLFALFKENGIFDPATSQKFLNTFLESGGAKEPLDLFIEFRGRPPEIEALLKSDGIV